MPIIIAVLITGGGFYIKAKLTDILTLQENNEKLAAVVLQQKEVFELKEASFARIRVILKEKQELNVQLQERIVTLKEKFNKIKPDGSKRDFGKLAVAKDKLIENIINKGTTKVFGCFESITDNEKDSINCGESISN